MVVKNEQKRLYDMIRDFFNVEIEGRRSAGTMRIYKLNMRRYITFLAQTRKILPQNLTFVDFCAKSIVAWQKSLLSEGTSPSTINNYTVIVREFLRYAALRDPSLQAKYNEVISLRKLKEEEDLTIRYFSRDVLREILKQCDRSSTTGHRDYVLMVLMFDTACRLQEIIGIKLSDIVFHDNSDVIYIKGKGGKKRIVGFTKETEEILKDFIARRHAHSPDTTPLFYVQDRKGNKRALTSSSVQKMIKSYADKARKNCDFIPEHVSPHMFRHSRAMDLLANGVDFPLIGQILGHTSLNTTLIYAKADIEMKKKAAEKAALTEIISCPEQDEKEDVENFFAYIGL